MAVRRESRFPISEILAYTPAIPELAQWGIFLRNHDELTLEMVTDEERDYMAPSTPGLTDEGQRRHPPPAGPLLENGPTRSNCSPQCCCRCRDLPVIYYGDEIGMGDIIWLGDRDGVHPDAVDAGPQRRVLQRQPRTALPSAQPRPGVRPVGECRSATGLVELPAELDANHACRPPPA